MHRPPFYPALFLAGLALLALVLLAYFPAVHLVNSLRDTVIQRLGEAMQQKVTLEIGGARLGLRHGLGFRMYDLSLSERGVAGERIFEAKYLFVALDLKALVRGNIRVGRLYLFQPRIFLSRDASGRLNVDRLFSAAYARRETGANVASEPLLETFGPLLWRDTVYLKNGEVVYRGSAGGGQPRVRVRNVDLQVNNRLPEDRVELALSGEIVSPAVFARLEVNGTLSGWSTARTPGELSCAFRMGVKEGDVAGLTGILPGLGPTDSLRGTMNASLSYEGALFLRGKGRLALTVDGPHVSLARVHPQPFSPDRLDLEARFEATREAVAFSEGRVDIGPLPIRWDGAFAFQQGSLAHLDVELAGEDLPLMEAKSYLPLGLLRGDAWRFLTAMVRGGRVDARARLQGAPADFARLKTPQGQDAIFLWLKFRDCSVSLPVPEEYLPFDRVYGELKLERGTLFFRHFRAAYGRTELPQMEGSIENVHQPVSHLCVRAGAQLCIPETFRELDHGIFPEAVRRIARSLQGAEGKGELHLQLDYTYGRKIRERLRVKGDAELEDVRAWCEPPGVSLSGVGGLVSFTESSVPRVDLRLTAGQSPLTLSGNVRFGGEKAGATGELRFASSALRAVDLGRWLGAGEQVQGVVDLRGAVAWRDGTMSWEGDLSARSLVMWAGAYGVPARHLRLEIEGGEDSLAIRALRARLGESEVEAEGRFSSLSPLAGRLDVRSPCLDLNRLLVKRPGDAFWDALDKKGVLDFLFPHKEAGSPDREVRLGLKCRELRFREVSLSDAVVEGGVRARSVFLEHGHGNVEGGSVIVQGKADLKDPRLPFSVLFGLSQIRTEAYCRWLSFSPDFIQGTASVEGSLEGNLRPGGSGWKDLRGGFSLYSDGCTIKRYDLLSKTLTLINFTQWTRVRLSDLYARGLPCRQIKGTFRLQQGALLTDDLVVDTSVAVVGFEGGYNILQDRLDAEVTLRPMEQLDQVLDLLPVVGKVIRGPDGTFVVFHYEVRGPLKDPKVELIPFKSLNERAGSPFEKVSDWLRNLDDRLQGRQPP